MSKPRFGYWNVRGIAEAIRYLLAYTKTEYDMEDYVTGDGPTYNKECWLSVKETLGLSFPNLPYYIDGDTKMNQTIAILNHLARKHGLCGKTEDERNQCDMICLEVMDFLMGFIKATYFCQNFEEDIKVYLKNIRVNVKRYANHLGQKTYIAGSNLTAADFMLWEGLDQLHTLDPTVLDEHENLKNYMKRIAELPGMKEYLESDAAKSRPISNKMAKWAVKPLPRPAF